ncbi:alkaline shock response membrane anchor protein AmaP [Kitasatospora sp. NPDC056138]|uniref:alkaline shock response membrane anchor protein AmaP n=1 Tax=Kitasatospora sp. NPDC056138 TaxID=3345724 RepID=UPI0035DE257A
MNTPSLLNRTLLALAGLVMLGGGLLVLAGGLGLYRRSHLQPPDGWPLTTPNAVLLTPTERTQWVTQDWWWPAVIAALAITALLALWWLLAQFRHSPGHLPVGTPPTEGVEVRADALGQALAADASNLPGVRNARSKMTGSYRRPQAHLTLTLAPHTVPRTALSALEDGPVRRARQATGWEQFPTRITLQVAAHPPHRAE